MFCSPELAARIDRAEGRLCSAIADYWRARTPNAQSFVLPAGGGAAVFAGPDSPINKWIGAGFDGPVNESQVAEVEAAFAKQGARLQAEVSTLADPGFHAMLASRGYVASGFENVLGYPVASSVGPAIAGVQVELAQPSELSFFADVLVEAFASPDMGGVGGDALPPKEEIRRWVLVTLEIQGFRGYLARIGNAIAGAGSLRIDSGVAQFSGAGTLPQFRRRGVQTALLRARLQAASREDCDVGVIVTQPGSKSQQNSQREGFALLYARQLWVKTPPR
jgi:GNAT superfamily N-acetyltransferase